MTEEKLEPVLLGLLRFFARSGLALALGSGWLGAANAATFFNLYNTTPAGGGTYNTQADADPGNTFGNYYSSHTTSSAKLVAVTTSALDANPIATGPFGIPGLNSEWLAPESSQAFAGLTGVLDSTAKLVAALSTDGFLHEYDAALAEGGEYDSLLTAKDGDLSPAPLAPAILLLGSALAGLVIVSRCRPKL
jgi:hypothetical protein